MLLQLIQLGGYFSVFQAILEASDQFLNTVTSFFIVTHGIIARKKKKTNMHVLSPEVSTAPTQHCCLNFPVSFGHSAYLHDSLGAYPKAQVKGKPHPEGLFSANISLSPQGAKGRVSKYLNICIVTLSKIIAKVKLTL